MPAHTGHRDAIRTCVSDKAPEFLRATKELNIAPFEGTPGRPTSHGKIERANRTVLEWTRPALEQSGLTLDWAGTAARHALFARRLSINNSDGVNIYKQKFPDHPMPSLWPFGAAVDFKPTPQQNDNAKCEPRARQGILVGYHLNPGGSWSGDYLCAELRNFETYSGKNRIRVYRTKSVTWRGDSRPTFPLYEAKERVKQEKVGRGSPRKVFEIGLLITGLDEAY